MNQTQTSEQSLEAHHKQQIVYHLAGERAELTSVQLVRLIIHLLAAALILQTQRPQLVVQRQIP